MDVAATAKKGHRFYNDSFLLASYTCSSKFKCYHSNFHIWKAHVDWYVVISFTLFPQEISQVKLWKHFAYDFFNLHRHFR